MSPDTETLDPVAPLTVGAFDTHAQRDFPMTAPQVCDFIRLKYTPTALQQFKKSAPDFPVPQTRGPGGSLFWWRSEIEAFMRRQPRSTANRWKPRGAASLTS